MVSNRWFRLLADNVAFCTLCSFQIPFEPARIRTGTDTGFFWLSFHLPSASTETIPSIAPDEASRISTKALNSPSPSTFNSCFSEFHSAFLIRKGLLSPLTVEPLSAGAFLTFSRTDSPAEVALTRLGSGTGFFCLNRQLPSESTETAPSITAEIASATFTMAAALPLPSAPAAC